jgi:hypothetical protein
LPEYSDIFCDDNKELRSLTKNEQRFVWAPLGHVPATHPCMSESFRYIIFFTEEC